MMPADAKQTTTATALIMVSPRLDRQPLPDASRRGQIAGNLGLKEGLRQLEPSFSPGAQTSGRGRLPTSRSWARRQCEAQTKLHAKDRIHPVPVRPAAHTLKAP